MSKTFDLVIFDCDGVLVDSEMLSARVLMGMMAKAGLPITPEIFRNDFLGRSFASAAARAEERFQRKLPDNFQIDYRSQLLLAMRAELQPMAGIGELLGRMAVPYCLATSSSPQRLALSLEVTGLDGYFTGRCSTASEVEHGKPAPDLCFLAARKMSADPASCLVIEDSEMGVRAARAAGMSVWHFAGGAHVRAGYRLPPDVVADRTIADVAALEIAFRENHLC
jgi:HAD superfamily hydrolase (TIGR01509 family)